MSSVPAASVVPVRRSEALRLVCTEVWGGNRAIDAPVELPGARGHIYSRPCRGGRGGDIHYLSVCGSGLIARICVADVVGHGEAVAQLSAEIHRLMRRYMNWLDQRRILRQLNRRLTRIGFKALTTAVAVTYYPPRRRLSVSYAGHPPAWLYRSVEERWVAVVAGERRWRGRREVDLPLAVTADTIFTRQTLRVMNGDRLVIVTDGVLEAPDGAGGRLNAEGFERLLHQARRGAPVEIVDAVVAAVGPQDAGAALHDDMTVLVLEFVAGPAGPAIWYVVRNRIMRPRGNSEAPAFSA